MYFAHVPELLPCGPITVFVMVIFGGIRVRIWSYRGLRVECRQFQSVTKIVDTNEVKFVANNFKVVGRFPRFQKHGRLMRVQFTVISVWVNPKSSRLWAWSKLCTIKGFSYLIPFGVGVQKFRRSYWWTATERKRKIATTIMRGPMNHY